MSTVLPALKKIFHVHKFKAPELQKIRRDLSGSIYNFGRTGRVFGLDYGYTGNKYTIDNAGGWYHCVKCCDDSEKILLRITLCPFGGTRTEVNDAIERWVDRHFDHGCIDTYKEQQS